MVIKPVKDAFYPGVDHGDFAIIERQLQEKDACVPHDGSSEEDVSVGAEENDFNLLNRLIRPNKDYTSGLASVPLPLVRDRWSEPNADSFNLRGKNYRKDRKKFPSEPSIGRLVACDFVQVDTPIYSGMSLHPSERIQLALKKDSELKAKGLESDMPPFLFVVNIIVPGPPFYHGVFYYAIEDMSSIDGSDGSPSSLLCKQFIFGESDSFRDKTFKLIPRVVKGNFVLRKAVGSTPFLFGTKLRQLYVRTDRSFEVILDCCGTNGAAPVIRLALGLAKSMVIDMGFVFEGKVEDHLPERLFGCVRIRRLDLVSVRKVEQPALLL